jgi:hypothetical protein
VSDTTRYSAEECAEQVLAKLEEMGYLTPENA